MLPFALALPSFAQDTTTPTTGAPTVDLSGGGFDAHGFRLATPGNDPRDPLGFVRPGPMESLQWGLGVAAGYAMRPLVFESPDGTRTEALRNVVALDVAAGFVPVEPIRIDLSMPLVLTSTGVDGVSGGPATRDLRASVLAALVQPDPEGFGMGLLAALDVPTGTPERWLGTPGVAGLLGVSSTWQTESVGVSWLVGGRLAPNTRPDERPAPTRGGDTLEGAGSVAYAVDETIGVGVEARVSVPVESTVRQAIGVPAEAMLTGRYHTGGGGFVSGGLGVGLGSGAGASPVRLVVGGGFGTGAERTPKDTDGDGIVDGNEACPTEAETVNGFRDDDGCPDTMPGVAFVAADPKATLVLTKPDGSTVEGTGRVAVTGLPGETYKVVARLGACSGGSAEGRVPSDGEASVEVPIGRQDGMVSVVVTDGAARPLDGALIRYMLADDACAPADAKLVAGRGTHQVGAGSVRVLVTAPGYNVYQEEFALEPDTRKVLEVKLAPTQVSVRDGQLKLAMPITFTADGKVEERSMALLQQVASVVLGTGIAKVQVTGWADAKGGKKLAQARADAVVAQLVSLGIPEASLSTAAKTPVPGGQKDLVTFAVSGP